MKIEVKNLTKKFKNNLVLDNVNVTFQSGKIYGIVGRNGSGKSVFLKMLCAFYIPTKGTILQDGFDYIKNNSFPKNTRAMIEGADFIPDLSGLENLKLLAAIQKKVPETDLLKIMKELNIYEERNQIYNEYSLGTKQKLGIAQVLMENPDLMILDEAFNGIDSNSVKVIKKILKDEKQKGKIIIITSHIKDDIKELADEVYEFSNGRLIKKNVKKNKK